MLNNKAININDIKPTIPRYASNPWCGQMKPSPFGNYVRHCDHIQEVEVWKQLYTSNVNHLEAVKEQRSYLETAKWDYKREVNSLLKDNSELILHNRKYLQLCYLAASVGVVFGATFTYLAILAKYN